MHTELQAVFDEHASPAHASKADVHRQLIPIVRLAASAQQQVLAFRAKIAEAELAPHDHALDGKLEMMHQTFAAMERESAALSTAARNLAQTFTQCDRYVAEWHADITQYENSAQLVAPIAFARITGVPVPSSN